MRCGCHTHLSPSCLHTPGWRPAQTQTFLSAPLWASSPCLPHTGAFAFCVLRCRSSSTAYSSSSQMAGCSHTTAHGSTRWCCGRDLCGALCQQRPGSRVLACYTCKAAHAALPQQLWPRVYCLMLLAHTLLPTHSAFFLSFFPFPVPFDDASGGPFGTHYSSCSSFRHTPPTQPYAPAGVSVALRLGALTLAEGSLRALAFPWAASCPQRVCRLCLVLHECCCQAPLACACALPPVPCRQVCHQG